MSQHGCGERLSNRSKVFQEEGPSEPTMEVLVETLTGTAFEMTVSPSDTVFAIKSKIFRVEGIPVAQQHLLYNLKELEDSSSLSSLGICSGARLRLVLGMRGGPISTRRLPPPAHHADFWPARIERLLESSRDDGDWSSGSGCKVTVLVFRDGERVNMLRVKENHDGTYSPLEHNKYSSSLTHLVESESDETVATALRDNAVTMNKMIELRRRMESLSLHRHTANRKAEKADIQKTRSEESLSVPSLLEDTTEYKRYNEYNEDDSFSPLYDGNYTRYEYDCSFPDRYTLLPPIGTRTDSDQSVQESVEELSDTLAGSILVKGRREDEKSAILEECIDNEGPLRRQTSHAAKSLAPIPAADYAVGWGYHSQSASSLALRPAPPRRAQPLFSSSTSELENIKRNSGRLLPALSRHRPRSQLHLSDSGLHLPPPPTTTTTNNTATTTTNTTVKPTTVKRLRCAVCRRRVGAGTSHVCACGATHCAAHRYPEVHGCNTHVRTHTLPRL